MQIRGKILTIAGIVLMFGYFIKDSLRDPYDPTHLRQRLGSHGGTGHQK